MNLARTCGITGVGPCPTQQSSTYGPGYSSTQANDGVTVQSSQNSGYSLTTFSKYPWWMVDFGSSRAVGSGKIWGVSQGSQISTHSFEVWIGNNVTYNGHGNILCYSSTASALALPPFTVSFTCVGIGRYSFVALDGAGLLAIVEFEIFAGSDLDDLHACNALTEACVDLSEAVSGTIPSARHGHGLATSDSLVYLFGGTGAGGEFLVVKRTQGSRAVLCCK